MNNMKESIIKLVRDTALKFSSIENPNFYEICSGLGLDVREVLLPDGVDGGQKGATIIINSRIKNGERKCFTRFHELMHYLIEKDRNLITKLRRLTVNQKGEYDRQIEKFCNIGAAEFLMPSKAFTKLYKEKGFNVGLVLYAASYFKSSPIAATIQLAQVAPHKCITAICEYGLESNNTTLLQDRLLNTEYCSPKPKLHVIYASPSPTTKYWLAKYTVIPGDHLIHEAFLQDQPVEAESYIPFRSGKKMPCYCEALADGDKVYVLFHLSPPPSPTHPDQMRFKWD